MRTIYNLMLTVLLLSLAATAAHAQFVAYKPLQAQGTMNLDTLSTEIALIDGDGSTFMLGGFNTEFEFAGRTIVPAPKQGKMMSSYLLHYKPDGSEDWAMHIAGKSVNVQSAVMMGDILLVAVRINGAATMVDKEGSEQLLAAESDGIQVKLLSVKATGELVSTKTMSAVDVENTEFSDLSVKLACMDNGKLAVAGTVNGALYLDGSEIIPASKIEVDLGGWLFTTGYYDVTFLAFYDLVQDKVEIKATFTSQTKLAHTSFLTMVTSGSDVYMALNIIDTVLCSNNKKLATLKDTTSEYHIPTNGMVLAKVNETNGFVWDTLFLPPTSGTGLEAQPWVRASRMVVVGDKLLMTGGFCNEIDFGNGVKLLASDTTGKKLATDYFFATFNTANGHAIEAISFGADSSEYRPTGLPTSLEHLQLVTDGQSAIMMGTYKGNLATPAGTFSSINGSVDNFMLHYNLSDKTWKGMSFGGPNNDYAANMLLFGDTLMLSGSFINSISFPCSDVVGPDTVYNAFCTRIVKEWFDITIASVGHGALVAPVWSSPCQQVNITTTPVSGYRLKEGSLKVYETGNPSNVVELQGNSFAMPRFAVTVEAEFEEVPIRSLNVSASPAEGGTISGQSTGNFDDGTAVTLTATPASGYRFVKWVEGATDISTDNPYTFSITADRSLVAVFERTTGLLDIRREMLSSYPNPTTGMLWVSVPELVEGTAAEVLVHNATGQLVLRIPSQGASAGSAASRISIDLSSYPSGLYIIRVGNAVAKVMKQ